MSNTNENVLKDIKVESSENINSTKLAHSPSDNQQGDKFFSPSVAIRDDISFSVNDIPAVSRSRLPSEASTVEASDSVSESLDTAAKLQPTSDDGTKSHLVPLNDFPAKDDQENVAREAAGLDANREIKEPARPASLSAAAVTPVSIAPAPRTPVVSTANTPVTSKKVTFKSPYKAPVTGGKVYDLDAGVIECICGFDHDDGFTIQCEKCNAWQHASCFDIFEEESAPEVWFCQRCSDQYVKYNSEMARMRQSDFLNQKLQAAENSPPAKGRRKRKTSRDGDGSVGSANSAEGSSATNSSSGNAPPTPKSLHNSFTSSERGTRKSQSGGPQDNGHGDKDHQSDSETDAGDGRFDTSTASVPSFMSDFIRSNDNWVNSKATEAELLELMTSTSDDILFTSKSEYSQISYPKISIKPTNEKQKSFAGFSRQGVFMESSIPKDRLIMEVTGNVMLKAEYKSNVINQYRQMGCPRFGVTFLPVSQLAIDGRYRGTEASFMRRSCTPNVKVSPCVIDKSDVRFAVFSLVPIKPGTELCCSWDWDPLHPASKLIDGEKAANLPAEERTCLSKTVGKIDERGMECGCSLAGECVLAKMRSAVQRERSTRNKSRASMMPSLTPAFDSDSSSNKRSSEDPPVIAVEAPQTQYKVTASPSVSHDRSRTTTPVFEKQKHVEMKDSTVQTEKIIKKLRVLSPSTPKRMALPKLRAQIYWKDKENHPVITSSFHLFDFHEVAESLRKENMPKPFQEGNKTSNSVSTAPRPLVKRKLTFADYRRKKSETDR